MESPQTAFAAIDNKNKLIFNLSREGLLRAALKFNFLIIFPPFHFPGEERKKYEFNLG
jgi:hypothetical protein